MTPQQFIARWGYGGDAFDLNEEQGAQSHFLELCELLDVPKPGSADYHFEEKSALIGGRTGYADVFKRGCFAWENKAPGKNLDAALRQLLTYSLALSNPPLLVVCDRLTIRIHTQFNGHPSEVYAVRLEELDQPEKRALLRKDLAERTFTKLYNLCPAWLDTAHKALDVAVARAYGWSDYSADMPDEEILQRLLALNLERS